MKSLTYSKKYEKASLLSRIKLTGYVYAKKVFGKFKFNYVLDLLNETLNFGSIFTLELTLMLMATGYLKTSWYFIVSTCYPIILGSIIYTVIFGSIIISKDTMSSTLYLMVETVQVSIIILLSYLLPIGTFYNLNFTFIFYYILINFCSKALFHF